MDHIILFKCERKPTIVNLLFVTSATSDEELQRLMINFVGGGVLDVEGQDAADVWEEMVTSRLSDSTTDDYDDGEEEGDAAEDGLEDDGLENAEIEADSRIERITRQIKDLENQIQLNRVDGRGGVFTLLNEVELLENRKPQTEEMERIREKALSVANAAEIIYNRQRINQFAATPITNISAMKALLNRLEKAKDALSERGSLAEEIQTQVRSVKGKNIFDSPGFAKQSTLI